MARMSLEQRHANRVARMLEQFKALRLGTCVTRTAKELQRAVRIEAADSDGLCKCVTCSKRARWNDGFTIQAGHFVAGRRNAVLFDERNLHPQCAHCNVILGGNQEVYAKYMLDRYGKAIVDELCRLRNETRQYTREELVRMRISYMDRVSKAKKRLSAKPF